jgi:GntR family transcriptional regulator/MocR family aminotransferase
MSKRATTLPLALPARPTGTPAGRWLFDAVRAAILDGRLAPGARLPATRDLARQYGLARGTIVGAFEQLRAEGYVTGVVGAGTFVSRVLPDALLSVRRRAVAAPAPRRPRERRLSAFAGRVVPFPPFVARPIRAFRANIPAIDLFPVHQWAKIISRRMRRAPASLLVGSAPSGYRPLQRAVAEYLSAARGVRCSAEQVMIVSGAQEALDLVARLLVDPGDRVCIEDPGYIGAESVLQAAGAQLYRAAVDEEGMMIPGPRVRDIRLVYTTPSHQYPLGVSMSLRRRLALLEWARSSGALIIEDDYDSEFRYAGRPLPALQSLDRHGLVCFVGSFSKVLFPSLRLGYLVVPPDLIEPCTNARSIISRHAPMLEQAVLCDFITEGYFGRHIRRMREVYAERLDVLLESARQTLGGALEISPVEAGLQTVGWLQRGIDGERLQSVLARRKVEVAPLGKIGGDGTRHALQLGFAAVDATEIRRGVAELAAALANGRSQAVRRTASPD